MAKQLKYCSNKKRLEIEEMMNALVILGNKLEKLGAKCIENYSEKGGRYEITGVYEFPRSGAVTFHFKQIAKGPLDEQPDRFNYNILINFLGFREDTKKYKKIKSSIENILNEELFKGAFLL